LFIEERRKFYFL